MRCICFGRLMGLYDNDVIKTAYAMHYYPIQWSVDSLDWKNYGVDSIITTVCNHKALAPGAIILCHNGAKYTADALDAMLTNLEEQGYKIVPISKLIMKKNYHMDATGKQIADDAEKQKDDGGGNTLSCVFPGVLVIETNRYTDFPLRNISVLHKNLLKEPDGTYKG